MSNASPAQAPLCADPSGLPPALPATSRYKPGVVSVLLHAIAIALVVALPSPQPFVIEDEAVSVEIVTLDAFETATGQTDDNAEGAEDYIAATRILSTAVLADPRSAEARATLANTDSAERMVQICNVEAMEQVALWDSRFRPDQLVAYARAEVTIAGRTVEADGGAVRSDGKWYDIRYRCELEPDLGAVATIAFSVGAPIPEGEWEDRNLAAGGGHGHKHGEDDIHAPESPATEPEDSAPLPLPEAPL